MHVLRSERLGTLWLAVAVVACLGVEGWRLRNPIEIPPLSVGELLFALESMPGATKGRESTGHRAFTPEVEGREWPVPGSKLDVSLLDSAGWTQWGLSPRQAKAAVSYAEAVGGLRDRRQLERMRALPEGWLDHFGPMLVFQPENGQARGGMIVPGAPRLEPVDGASSRPTLPRPSVDINVADSMELLAIKGVGPWVAHRILDARRRWGGFVEVSQLREAFGGWDSMATALAPAFHCSPGMVTRRCPDTLDADGWRRLPGVGWRQAETLERFARHHRGEGQRIIGHPVLDSAQWTLLSGYLDTCDVE